MSFTRENINPAGLYKHPAFTRVVTVKGPMKLISIAGQTASDENYVPVGGTTLPSGVVLYDYKAQYLKVIENLTVQLEAAGATWDDVVFRRFFTLDVDLFLKALYEVHGDPANRDKPWNPQVPPPSTLIGVTRLSYPEFLIEIDLMAVVADD